MDYVCSLGVVVGADFCSTTWALEGAVSIGFVYVEFIGSDLLRFLFLEHLQPQNGIKGFFRIGHNFIPN